MLTLSPPGAERCFGVNSQRKSVMEHFRFEAPLPQQGWAAGQGGCAERIRTITSTKKTPRSRPNHSAPTDAMERTGRERAPRARQCRPLCGRTCDGSQSSEWMLWHRRGWTGYENVSAGRGGHMIGASRIFRTRQQLRAPRVNCTNCLN